MLAELRHVRLNLWQLPHLMPQGLAVLSLKQRRAASAEVRKQIHDFIALFGGQEGSLMPRVALLSTPLSLVLTLLPRWSRMRMLAAGRQGRILRCQFGNLRLQPLDFRQQKPDDRLHIRRLRCQPFFRDHGRHAHVLVEKRISSKDQFLKTARSRMVHPVNGYMPRVHRIAMVCNLSQRWLCRNGS